MRLSTHSQKLERWIGADEIERISLNMKEWYGPPIAVGRVPGAVYACGGGDFRGHVEAGSEASLIQYAWDRAKRLEARWARAFDKWARQQPRTLNAGFASLSDLIAEATAGKKLDFQYQKIGTSGVVGVTNTLWFVGPVPPAGAAAGAAPGGTAWTDASTGGFVFTNPTGGDTMHFVAGYPTASLANTLLLYDRLFSCTKTMASSATEAVTGVPTRYQASSGADYSAGNFLMIEVRTALPATAHNHTVVQYTDQDGNTGASAPSMTGNASAIINRLDHPVMQWFMPLATGDTGIRELTQMQHSASIASGALDYTIGHPIAIMPCPVPNICFVTDGINSAFNLERIFDDACLALLELSKPATGATTYNGMFATVAG